MTPPHVLPSTTSHKHEPLGPTLEIFARLGMLDLDLNLNRTVKAQAVAGQPRKYLSLVVLGNGVHWEAKSRKVLDTFVEHAFLVPDEAIIRYCEYVRALADQAGQGFLNTRMASRFCAAPWSPW